MSFFTAKVDSKAISDNNFEFINESGIYDVTIDFISVKVNDHGARSLDFNLSYKGSNTTIYGLKLDDNKGNEHFQRNIFNKLCIIAGIEEVAEPVVQTHLLGKDKKPTDLAVLDDFTGLNVKAWVKYSYSVYDGKIREQREIMGFYRAEDGATASEIVNKTQPGVRLAKDLEKSKDVKYTDGLTPEKVAEWKASLKGGETPKAETPKTSVEDNPFSKNK